MTAVIAALGLGGNVGDVPAAMGEALRAIDARSDCTIKRVSRLYRTPPWGKTDQPWFVNACALVETVLSPHDMLDLCLDTERAHGRVRTERWGPRTLDIDLLDHGGEALDDERLTLPHPRAAERAFVLTPLAEIAPDLLIGGKSVAEHESALHDAAMESASTDGEWWRAHRAPGEQAEPG